MGILLPGAGLTELPVLLAQQNAADNKWGGSSVITTFIILLVIGGIWRWLKS